MLRHRLFALLAAAFALATPLHGQGNKDLLTTVGTTVTRDGRTHAYLLWQPGDTAASFGKRYAIHSKPGSINDPGAFTRVGIQTLQTSPSTIRALLELGTTVDRAAAQAPERIDGLYREVLLRQGESSTPAADPSLDAAGKLAYLIQGSATDPTLLGRLFFLGRAHPGVMQCLGHSFIIPIPAGTTTYEIREIDGSDNDIRVVGRVALNPASPVILDAPASPVVVPHPVTANSQFPVSPKDNLNARFRWGISPTLREKMPYSFGFDLFRVKKATATALGWHLSPPSPSLILDALTAEDPADPDPEVSLVNTLPILVGDLLDPATAGNLSIHPERFDIADDGIWHAGPEGTQIRRPFSDGEQFYYFVAARTITGAPGNLSSGTLVTMCDRLPPSPPTIASVLSTVVPGTPGQLANQNAPQFLQVKFRQLPEDPLAESATGYYIYRWSSSQEYLSHLGNPVINRVGYVSHQPGQTFATFNDNGAGAPTLASHTDQAVWYTIRAVGQTACSTEVISGHSGPVSGVLRDFKSPDRPTASFQICRNILTTTYEGRSTQPLSQNPPPADFRGIIVLVERTHPSAIMTEIEIRRRGQEQNFINLYTSTRSFQNSNQIRIDLPYLEPKDTKNPLQIRVRGISSTGFLSPWASQDISSTNTSNYATHFFKISSERSCSDVHTSTDFRPVHETSEPDGSIIPIVGVITIPASQGVREWRIYRRVGPDGDLALIAKKEGSLPPSDVWQDDALPAANGATVCYFAQVFDQNANPGPLTPISCITLANPNLATPLLSPAQTLSASGGFASVKLEWFCDPVGVDRFEILVAQQDGGMPDIQGLSDALSTSPVTGISSDFPDLSFYPFQTARLGSAFGNGPGFGQEILVPADKVLYFAVRAAGPGTYPRTTSTSSNVVTARWISPATGPQPVIPWPARPLPGLYDARRSIEDYAAGEGPLWPISLPAGNTAATGILVGLTRHQMEISSTMTMLFSPEPPEYYLFKTRPSDGTAQSSLMPFMIYRYQLPSTAFPNARPNLVQCSPLIDRISWKLDGKKEAPYYQIRDPYFGFTYFREDMPIPTSGPWDDSKNPNLGNPAQLGSRPPVLEGATGLIYVRDLLPVISGARYRHLFVTFTADGEISRVIPLQPIQH